MPSGHIAPKTPSKEDQRLSTLEYLDEGADFVGALHDADEFMNDLIRQESAYEHRLTQVNRHAQRLAGELDRIRTIKEGVQHAINQLYGYNVHADIPTPAESVGISGHEAMRRAEADAKAVAIRRDMMQGAI